MNLRTLKFAKRGNDYLTESKQAIATAFRHYINLAQPSGFSDIDTTAHPEEYTPLLYVNRDDLRNNMLYEDDVVFIELPNIYEFEKKSVAIVRLQEKQMTLLAKDNFFYFAPSQELSKIPGLLSGLGIEDHHLDDMLERNVRPIIMERRYADNR